MIYTYSDRGITRIAIFDNDKQAREFLEKHPRIRSLCRIKTPEETEKRYLKQEKRTF